MDAGEDLDQRRLAGAVGAEEGVDLAAPDRQVDAAQGLGAAEALVQIADDQQRLGRGPLVFGRR